MICINLKLIFVSYSINIDQHFSNGLSKNMRQVTMEMNGNIDIDACDVT